MEGMEYFYELFDALPRGGPGDNASTRRAYNFIKGLPKQPFILDIGCGRGVQTIELAKISKGKIIALDNHQPFLDKLMQNAETDGVSGQIIPKNQSMLEMDFKNNTFDLIWSEGALFIMGFQNGLKRCHQLLKRGGTLAVTEAVLLSPDPPPEVRRFWENVYPVIMDIEGNLKLIEKEGFDLISSFTLPKSSWLDGYYSPMEKPLAALKMKYSENQVAMSVFDLVQNEIDFYKKYSDYYGYEFFIMRKRANRRNAISA
jgi:ubiquinone/menaquinone biosynthesis C-methylase UbiE